MKYYDWESEYFTFSDEKILRRGEFFDNELKRIVEFIVVKEVEKKEELFLYYNYGNFKFHIPTKKIIEGLEIIQVDNIASEVVDEKNLLSI